MPLPPNIPLGQITLCLWEGVAISTRGSVKCKIYFTGRNVYCGAIIYSPGTKYREFCEPARSRNLWYLAIYTHWSGDRTKMVRTHSIMVRFSK